MHLVPFTTEEFETELSTHELVDRYFDVAACEKACLACDKHGRNWSCPPFDFDPVGLVRSYSTATVLCSKATLMRNAAANVPVAEYPIYVRETFALAKLTVEDKLLAREKRTQGSLALFPGSCMRCPHGCKRAENAPCISPATLRYSLEALGGVMAPLVKDSFGLEFCWSAPDELPEYFLLVSALLQ